MISIIVPTLNEAGNIKWTLEPLQSLRHSTIEIIVVDGGSTDATLSVAKPLADQLISSPPGRATQMNAGGRLARGDCLIFLHADTHLPVEKHHAWTYIVETTNWGRFDVQLDSGARIYRIIEKLMNWRSCLSGIATGDQAIFLKRNLFKQLGGFPEIPLMEDIALSKQLKTFGKPCCIPAPVRVSVRYWETHGVFRSILKMWYLRAAYALGVPPQHLHQRYYGNNE